MKIINLTPHEINIYRAGLVGYDHVLTVPPSGNIARVEVKRKIVKYIKEANGEWLDPGDEFGGLPILASDYGEPTMLPPQKAGVIYIVSLLYKSACEGRNDLYSPGELLRDENGQPYGCFGLSE